MKKFALLMALLVVFNHAYVYADDDESDDQEQEQEQDIYGITCYKNKDRAKGFDDMTKGAEYCPPGKSSPVSLGALVVGAVNAASKRASLMSCAAGMDYYFHSDDDHKCYSYEKMPKHQGKWICYRKETAKEKECKF